MAARIILTCAMFGLEISSVTFACVSAFVILEQLTDLQLHSLRHFFGTWCPKIDNYKLLSFKVAVEKYR